MWASDFPIPEKGQKRKVLNKEVRTSLFRTLTAKRGGFLSRFLEVQVVIIYIYSDLCTSHSSALERLLRATFPSVPKHLNTFDTASGVLNTWTANIMNTTDVIRRKGIY